MSVELDALSNALSDVLKSDQKHLGSQQEMWFESPHRLDDAFWGITVVPKYGTSNVVLEVTGQMIQCDREGNRTLSIRIKNTGHTEAYFTLYAARSPNYSRDEGRGAWA